MSLAKALNNARQAGKGLQGLHLKYLEAYAEQASTPSLNDAVLFLDLLRQGRSTLHSKAPGTLKRYEAECLRHEGYIKFRSQFVEGHEFDQPSSTMLVRIYSNLRRMNLHSDAEKLWPRVYSFATAGPMPRVDLLRIWATCPPAELPKLDATLGKALGNADSLTSWQLLSALSRSGALPPRSATLKACLDHLWKMVKEFQANPEDIAKMLARLHLASKSEGAGIEPEILDKIKKELVATSPTLDVDFLCSLLPVIESSDETLWVFVRDQLLQKKRMPLQNSLDVLEFLNRVPGKKGAQKLRLFVEVNLEMKLSKAAQSDPSDVARISRHLHVVASSGKICQGLLNTAINMRKDLYPVVLWLLFMRTGEAGLAQKHPELLVKFDRVGEILESHGIPEGRMSMMEMLKSVRAMRQNQVKMPKCVEQIVQHFLRILQQAQEHVGGHLAAEASQEASGLGAAMGKPLLDNAGEDEAVQDESLEAQRLGAAAKKPPLDDAREGQPEETADEETADQGLEVQQDQDASDTKSDPSTVKRKDLLAEVQHLVLLLWAELEQQALENSELSAAARDVCEPERCKLDVRRIAECLVELSALETASILCEKLHATFLESLPALAGSELLELTAKVSFDVQAAAMAVQELDKRVMEDRLSVSDSADVDYLIQCASNLKRAARAERAGDVEVVQEQMIKVCKLLLEHMPEKPEKVQEVMSVVCAALADLGLEEPIFNSMLYKGLRVLARNPEPCDGMVELLFSLAGLHGGKLPFNMLAYAWVLATHCAAEVKSAESCAKLWALALAARHLSSKTAWTNLRLAPNAAALDRSVFPPKDSKLPAFGLEGNRQTQELQDHLRLALAFALPAQLSEEQLQVPGTPFVVDFGFERLCLGIVVPRAAHKTSGNKLTGHARLMEATLKAMGWRVLWAWPDELAGLCQETPDDSVVAALRSAIEEGKSISAARRAAGVGQEVEQSAEPMEEASDSDG